MDKKLKIAQLVLPWLPVPPKAYGGTEIVVHYITEELVKRGHEVTLFSVGNSITSAKLKHLFPKALGLQENVRHSLASNLYPLMHVANCFERQEDFDIIHSHAQFLGLPFSAVAKTPTVHTFHREFNNLGQDEQDLLNHYKSQRFISISNSQRTRDLNFIGTVYNGIDTDIYSFAPTRGQDYLMWAGRLIDKKGPKEAIEVAKKLNIQLIMAGTATDQMYYKEVMEQEFNNPLIKFRESIEQSEMVKLYQGAKLLLMPIKWNEPFGLTAAEAMSCGTPVVAFGEGAIPETIKDGESGFIIGWQNPNMNGVIKTSGIDGLAEATQRIFSMGNEDYSKMREQSRKRAEENFTIEKMVDGYEEVYRKVLSTG